MMTRFYASPQDGSAIQTGDFNGDGIVDLITGNNCGDNGSCQGLTVYLGNGDGTFQSGVSSMSQIPATDIAIGDFNGDGKLDVAAAAYVNGGQDGTLQIELGNGDGTFTQGQSVALPTNLISFSLTTGDFNGDGKLDVALTVPNQVLLYQGNGDGTFTSAGTVNFGSNDPIKVRAGDFNGDHKSDLGVLTTTGLDVLWSNGNFSFTNVSLASYPNDAADMSVADVNQDGFPDLLVTYYNCANQGCTTWAVFQSRGIAKAFRKTAQVTYSGFGLSSPLAADVNGDGINDIVLLESQAASNVTTYLGNPDGTYQTTPTLFNIGTNGAEGLVQGDFNRDGKIDFATVIEGNATLATLLNATPRAACQINRLSPSVTVCQPQNLTYSNSPLLIKAGATDSTQVTSMQVFVDNHLSFQTSGSSLQKNLTLALGNHTLLVRAQDASGRSFSSPRQVTIFSGTAPATCATPPSTMTICAPTQNETTGTSIHILANADSSNPITATQVYIDNVEVYNDTSGTTYVDSNFTVSVGSHSIVVKSFDSHGSIFSASVNITAN
jgi:FG-GAP-like repeat/Bacterial Ig domain